MPVSRSLPIPAGEKSQLRRVGEGDQRPPSWSKPCPALSPSDPRPVAACWRHSQGKGESCNPQVSESGARKLPGVSFSTSRGRRLVCKVALEVGTASAGMKPLCSPPTQSPPGSPTQPRGPSVQTRPLSRPRSQKPEDGAREGTSRLRLGISSQAPAARLFANPGNPLE